MKIKTLSTALLLGLGASLMATCAQADLLYHLREGDDDITAPSGGVSSDDFMGYSDARKPQAKSMVFLGVTGNTQYTFSDWNSWLSTLKQDDASSNFDDYDYFLQSPQWAFIEARPAFLFAQDQGQLVVPKSGDNVFEVVLSRYNIDEYPVALYAKGNGAKLDMQAPFAAIEIQGFAGNPLSDEYALAPYAAYATDQGQVKLGDVNGDQVVFGASNGGVLTIDGVMHAGDSVFYPVGVVFQTKATDVFNKQPTVTADQVSDKDPKLNLPSPPTSAGIINLILQAGSRVALGLNIVDNSDNGGASAAAQPSFDENSTVTNLVLAKDAQVSISNNWLQVLYADRWCYNDNNPCINGDPEDATFGDYKEHDNGNYDLIAEQGFGAKTQVNYQFFNPRAHQEAFATGSIQEALTETQDYILGSVNNKDVEHFQGRTLTVQGDYASLSDDNLLVFTVVADANQNYNTGSAQNADNSLHDQLIIEGRAVGKTAVQVYLVNNVKTLDEKATPAITHDGIPLITVKAQKLANGFITQSEAKVKNPLVTLPDGTKAESLPSAQFVLAAPVLYGNLSYNLGHCNDTWYLYNNTDWVCKSSILDPKTGARTTSPYVQRLHEQKAAYRAAGSAYLSSISQSLSQFNDADLLTQTSLENPSRMPMMLSYQRLTQAQSGMKVHWVLSAKTNGAKADKTLELVTPSLPKNNPDQVYAWVSGAYLHASFQGTDQQYDVTQNGMQWMIGADKSLFNYVGQWQLGGFVGFNYTKGKTNPSGKVQQDFPSHAETSSFAYSVGFYGNLRLAGKLKGAVIQTAVSYQLSKNELTDMLSRKMSYKLQQFNVLLGYAHRFPIHTTGGNGVDAQSQWYLTPSAALLFSHLDMGALKQPNLKEIKGNAVHLDEHLIPSLSAGLRLGYSGNLQQDQEPMHWDSYVEARYRLRLAKPTVIFEVNNSPEAMNAAKHLLHLQLGGGISRGNWHTGLSAYYALGNDEYRSFGLKATLQLAF